LERKRAALRRALKTEFIRKRYHPDSFKEGGVVFDAAMQRFHALKNTEAQYYYPTLRNFVKFFSVYFAPAIFVSYFYLKDRVMQ